MGMSKMQSAKIYLRHNGAFGSQCDGTRDTGHHIAEDSGQFLVRSVHDESVIAKWVSREEAEEAITKDWRK
jgi:ATP sulfurylase